MWADLEGVFVDRDSRGVSESPAITCGLAFLDLMRMGWVAQVADVREERTCEE